MVIASTPDHVAEIEDCARVNPVLPRKFDLTDIPLNIDMEMVTGSEHAAETKDTNLVLPCKSDYIDISQQREL